MFSKLTHLQLREAFANKGANFVEQEGKQRLPRDLIGGVANLPVRRRSESACTVLPLPSTARNGSTLQLASRGHSHLDGEGSHIRAIRQTAQEAIRPDPLYRGVTGLEERWRARKKCWNRAPFL